MQTPIEVTLRHSQKQGPPMERRFAPTTTDHIDEQNWRQVIRHTKRHTHTKHNHPQEQVGDDGQGLSVITAARAFNSPNLAENDHRV